MLLPPILADLSWRHVPSRKVDSAHSIAFFPYMSRPCKHWKLNCQFTTYTLAFENYEGKLWNKIQSEKILTMFLDVVDEKDVS
jgi:hypothetical protein